MSSHRRALVPARTALAESTRATACPVVLPGTFRRRGGVAAVPADPPATTELDEAA